MPWPFSSWSSAKRQPAVDSLEGTPPPAPETRGLGDSINVATRVAHSRLNRKILQFLPFALPPHAGNPSVYVSGMIHILQLYLEFESLWNDILEGHQHINDKGSCYPKAKKSDESHTRTTSSTGGGRVHDVLSKLRLPLLMRSESLCLDILSITGWSVDTLDKVSGAVSQTGVLAEFIPHLQESITNHPHVLVAYAWIFYMALFSGGRFIRAALEAAGPGFWGAPSDPVQPCSRVCVEPVPVQKLLDQCGKYAKLESEPATAGRDAASEKRATAPLEFFRFATPEDGEDLKTEFKARVRECERVLTPTEKDQIIQEAVRIFGSMNDLVDDLDGILRF